MPSSLPPGLTSTLQSYLEGQRVAGRQSLPWNGTLPGERSGGQPPPPAPPAPAPPPPLEKNTPTSALPQAPATPAVVEPSAPRISWLRAKRHPEAPAGSEPDAPTLLVISDHEEFQGAPGALLKEMLHAIGFVPCSDPAGLSEGVPEDASRVLILGNDALQSVSTAGMDLQLIRGLWQKLPPGRSLATYAPSDVTDSPSGKKTVWNDLQNLMEDLSLEIPEWTKKRLKRS